MLLNGIDVLLKDNPGWKSKRIALVTNKASLTVQKKPTRNALIEKGFNIVKLFSPEHGLESVDEDGVAVPNRLDILTRLPIISLYGDKLSPALDDVADVEVLMFDVPDIGCRFYTYLWTLTYLLEVAKKHQKKIIILDRPNPLSGNMALSEGPMLQKKCASFIGRWPIPVRHSCTLGELAIYFNSKQNIHADVEVIKCDNYNRLLFQPQLKTEFIPTSPAIQSFDAALCYPGTGLLEATNISEGRGTSNSFRLFGSPWLDNNLLIDEIMQHQSGIVQAKAVEFVPYAGKYVHEKCVGIELNITQPDLFAAVKMGLFIIKCIKDVHPGQFEWKTYPTHVNPNGTNHLDKLLGILHSERIFNLSMDQFAKEITKITQVPDWEKEITPFLLY